MSRGKRLGLIAVFHNYSYDDKRNCLERGNCKRKDSYAISKSMKRRKERSDAIRRNPDLGKVLYYRKLM